MAGTLVGPVHGFMVWNLFLAAIPAALAPILFRRARIALVPWWVLFAVWLVFLPNAPYVLTDVVHLFDDVRDSRSATHACVVLALYGTLFTCGLASYVWSLQWFRRFLQRVVTHRVELLIVLAVHALCVVAMYLGRVGRLNSWDTVREPERVIAGGLRAVHPSNLALLGTMFVVVGVGAFVMALVGGEIWHRLRSRTGA